MRTESKSQLKKSRLAEGKLKFRLIPVVCLRVAKPKFDPITLKHFIDPGPSLGFVRLGRPRLNPKEIGKLSARGNLVRNVTHNARFGLGGKFPVDRAFRKCKQRCSDFARAL